MARQNKTQTSKGTYSKNLSPLQKFKKMTPKQRVLPISIGIFAIALVGALGVSIYNSVNNTASAESGWTVVGVQNSSRLTAYFRACQKASPRGGAHRYLKVRATVTKNTQGARDTPAVAHIGYNNARRTGSAIYPSTKPGSSVSFYIEARSTDTGYRVGFVGAGHTGSNYPIAVPKVSNLATCK